MNRRIALFPLLALAAVLPFVDSLLAEPRKPKGTQWAILIAGARYQHLQPIRGEETINDIVEFKKALLATGFSEDHILMIHDRQAQIGGAGAEYLPEHDKIVEVLGKFLRGMDEEDTVLVVLSGHGVMFQGDRSGYFCPVDADLSPRRKLIPMEGPGGIYTQLENCRAGRKLLIANTCRNAPEVARPVDLAGDRIELVDDYPELDRVPKGIAAFYSCDRTQKSHFDPDRKRSLFFIHLTDAWKGGSELEEVFKKAKDATKADALKTFRVEQFPVKKLNFEGEWMLYAVGLTEPRAGEERSFEIADGVPMVFCWIPKGKATLGSPETENERDGDEAEHEYEERTGFWLGKYEVTQRQWEAVMETTPFYFHKNGDGSTLVTGLDTRDFPAELVSFDDIYGEGWQDGESPKPGSYLAKVNGRPGAKEVFGKVGTFALPNENRWEYAYRGGQGNGRPFYWGDTLNGDRANCDGNFQYGTTTKGDYLARPTAVGSYAAKTRHPWGLCDMSGNIHEWCQDKYSKESKIRVLRGGSWHFFPWFCRAAGRFNAVPANRGYDVGFRLCVVLD